MQVGQREFLMAITTSPPREEILESKVLSHLNMVYPIKFILELLMSSESQIFIINNISYNKKMKFECKSNNFDL